MCVLGDSLGYQGLNARSAKETLQQRTAVLEEYQPRQDGNFQTTEHREAEG